MVFYIVSDYLSIHFSPGTFCLHITFWAGSLSSLLPSCCWRNSFVLELLFLGSHAFFLGLHPHFKGTHFLIALWGSSHLCVSLKLLYPSNSLIWLGRFLGWNALSLLEAIAPSSGLPLRISSCSSSLSSTLVSSQSLWIRIIFLYGVWKFQW